MTDANPKPIYRIADLHEIRPSARTAGKSGRSGVDQCRVDRHPAASWGGGGKRGGCGSAPAEKIRRHQRVASRVHQGIDGTTCRWGSQSRADQSRHRIGQKADA